jgi:hypothetical protein
MVAIFRQQENQTCGEVNPATTVDASPPGPPCLTVCGEVYEVMATRYLCCCWNSILLPGCWMDNSSGEHPPSP